jgi:hypothetical protein
MTSKRSPRALALKDSPVHDPASMVEITFEIRADALTRIDALCEACKPVEITRPKMLRIMVQTGILYWESQPESGNSEEVTKDGKLGGRGGST